MRFIFLFSIFLMFMFNASASDLVGNWKLVSVTCPDNRPIPENTSLKKYEPIINAGLFLEFNAVGKATQTVFSPLVEDSQTCTIRSTMDYAFTGSQLTMSGPTFDLSECYNKMVTEQLSKPVVRPSLTVAAALSGDTLTFTHAAEPRFPEHNCTDSVRVIEVYELQNN